MTRDHQPLDTRAVGLPTPRVAVVGAGLAGLMAARQMTTYSAHVTVFEKSRAPGGRAATRHQGEAHFDHGAQYFTHRDPRCAELVAQWASAGVIAPSMARMVAVTEGVVTPVSDVTTRWVAVPGMRALGVHLAQGANVRYETTVHRVTRDGTGWHLRGQNEEALGTFDQVLITAPAPQAYALLAPHAPSFTAALGAAQMHPCIALMVSLATRPSVPWDAAFVNAHPVASWIARNGSKPGRGLQECWVLHASADWSRAHLEHEPQSLVPELVDALAHVLGERVDVAQATAHRWRFAIPDSRELHGNGEAWYDAGLGLGVGGDWCAGGRVEGALTSGLVLGDLAHDAWSRFAA